jgi:hypothetical protein
LINNMPAGKQKGSTVTKTASDVAALGGAARAKKLSKQQRSQIAQQGALARWSPSGPLVAEFGDESRPLRIGAIEIPCYVLSDGRRVLSQRGLQGGIGLSRSGGKAGARRVAQFLTSLQVKGFETSELVARVNHPIRFVPPHGGNLADGYEATILPDICEAVVKADQAGKLKPQQRHVAEQCRILLHGFANVGIIALVDEATGYQAARERNALAKILEQFVAREYRKWVRTFPVEYYRELCRLRSVPFPTQPPYKLPSYFGHLTNDIVYARLAPGVLAELRRKNPTIRPGQRKRKHFQWLTEDVGDPRLREHLWSIIMLMRIHNEWDAFYAMLEQYFPKYSDLPLLTLMENEGTPMLGVEVDE